MSLKLGLVSKNINMGTNIDADMKQYFKNSNVGTSYGYNGYNGFRDCGEKSPSTGLDTDDDSGDSDANKSDIFDTDTDDTEETNEEFIREANEEFVKTCVPSEVYANFILSNIPCVKRLLESTTILIQSDWDSILPTFLDEIDTINQQRKWLLEYTKHGDYNNILRTEFYQNTLKGVLIGLKMDGFVAMVKNREAVLRLKNDKLEYANQINLQVTSDIMSTDINNSKVSLEQFKEKHFEDYCWKLVVKEKLAWFTHFQDITGTNIDLNMKPGAQHNNLLTKKEGLVEFQKYVKSNMFRLMRERALFIFIQKWVRAQCGEDPAELELDIDSDMVQKMQKRLATSNPDLQLTVTDSALKLKKM
jgi:hypothetical protein